jgi:hypothetical protein
VRAEVEQVSDQEQAPGRVEELEGRLRSLRLQVRLLAESLRQATANLTSLAIQAQTAERLASGREGRA